MTPSAVSQRIKALEQFVGEVLVVREKPCTATATGIPLLRLAGRGAGPDGRKPWCGTAHAVAAGASVAWNRGGALQDRLVRRVFRRDIGKPQHFVPTAERFGAAARGGLGWGMFPDSLAASRLRDGSFVQVTDAHLDVPLYWQCWKLDSPTVQELTATVRTVAAKLTRRQR